jgi:hypothetical protein
MSQADLEESMHLAAIAGQMQAVSSIADIMGMPLMSLFLEDKSFELQDIATDSMLRFGATRALAAAMGATGAEIADLGVNEMAEGLTRLAVAGDIAFRSEELAEAGAADFVAGVSEVAAAEALDEVARDVAAEGVAEIAVGSAELAESDMLHAAGEVAREDED